MRPSSERHRADEILRILAEGTARATGEEFFRSLVRQLAAALNVRYAFVTECLDTRRTRVRTLAFWDGQSHTGNISYPVTRTPCENVMGGQVCVYPRSVQASFPQDDNLVAWRAESYLGVPIFGSSGRVLGHLAVLDEKPLDTGPRDLSILEIFAGRTGVELERQRAEEALRESEERYRSLYTKTPVMLHSNDAEGRLVSVSDHWLETLGYARDEVLGEPATRFLTYASREHAERTCFPAFMETGVLVDEPLEFQRKNGEVVDVLLSAIVERDEDDQFVRSLAVSVDVTERNRAERAVERYTKRLEILREIDRAILEARSAAAIGQAAMERVPELVPCRRATLTAFHPDGGEALVRAAYSTGDGALAVGERVPLEVFGDLDALREGRVHVVPDTEKLPDGPRSAFSKAEGLRSWLNVPVISHGELIGAVSVGSEAVDPFSPDEIQVVRDVADSLAIAIRQTRLLERLQAQAEELERRVAERTAELETFSYSISHDLRAPLRAIDGYSRVLWEEHAEHLDTEGRRLLDVVRASGTRMGQLIDDLLVFFGLSRREMRAAEVELAELVRDVFEELTKSLPPPVPRLALGPLPRALGDRAMLRQVLVNLLSNAVKFSRSSDRPVIEVGHDDGAYYVRDNGVGFDEKYAHKLFGVFQRLHSAEEFEGTGLGLAITHRIVERHGGRVWAEGRPGRGATVYFTLSP